MRILFLESHPRWIYGLPNGFLDAGHEVKFLNSLAKKNIPKILSEFNPNLVVSMGWTPQNNDKKFQVIRRYIKTLNIPYIYWATEDPGYTHMFTLPFIQRTQPEFVFTICHERIKYYKKLGIKAGHLDFGYHESIHCPLKCESMYKSSIAVVANAYPNFLKKHPDHFRLKSIKTLIEPILKEKIHIDFWGNDWDKMNSILEYDIPKECIRGYIPYTETNKVYSSADIIIGIQNQYNHPQLCQRTYEVLGSEGFLLTSDTPAVKHLFKPGQDLIVSSSPEDTIKLVRYYLERPEERDKIRINGKKTVAKHSYKHRAKYIIDTLKKEGIIPQNIK
ncbi:glycosyltransferase [Clostridium aestuarii]|uniref:Glycosyltransferase n=1 Tax=Clostridium aestuarii TaxID=338193 RepID=A0ABT4D2N8_9CLOT|nr:glycosyltransferase [Clostridium aestuarii]MCY6485382.1 glycosyltransferase [Clostridium aestuarii]